MSEESLRQLYLDLIKRTIIGMIYEDVPHVVFLDKLGIGKPTHYIRKFRELGRDFPSQAHSAIGMRRMSNLQACIEQILTDGVPGDLMETGIWRGGACIFMRAVLKAYGVTDRVVWAADSFEGLPPVNAERYPQDEKLDFLSGTLAVSLETVQHNFAVYGLLDDQVQFLKGWFRDTLPAAPATQLALLRLDGDLYESTTLALRNLYPKLAVGGFVIIDDWNIGAAQEAVMDYRSQHAITEEIMNIDGWSVYWRRER